MKLTTITTPPWGKTDFEFPTKDLESSPCGLHRANLKDAPKLMPMFADLFKSAPINPTDPSEWVVDLKIHMLMKGMYPCIPNWHCDNVPRDENNRLQYGLCDVYHPMWLWISNGPSTQFLDRELEVDDSLFSVDNHGDLNNILSAVTKRGTEKVMSLEPQQWHRMYQNTPHRGVAATKHQWRVFVRLSHKSMCSARPVNSVIRRHAQVYLPHDFHW